MIHSFSPLGNLQVVSNLLFNALDDFCHSVDVIRRAEFFRTLCFLTKVSNATSVLYSGKYISQDN